MNTKKTEYQVAKIPIPGMQGCRRSWLKYWDHPNQSNCSDMWTLLFCKLILLHANTHKDVIGDIAFTYKDLNLDIVRYDGSPLTQHQGQILKGILEKQNLIKGFHDIAVIKFAPGVVAKG